MNPARFVRAIIILLFTCLHATAQDYIKKYDGKELNVNIVDAGLTEIKYKLANDSSVYSIPKSDVMIFRYGVTAKDSTTTAEGITKQAPRSQMYHKGVHDAEIYYRDYKAAAAGTYWTTVAASPLLGLIPATVTSSNPPREINLGYPDSLLMKNPDYYLGYTAHAKMKKEKKVWRSYLGGLLTDLAIVIVLLSLGN